MHAVSRPLELRLLLPLWRETPPFPRDERWPTRLPPLVEAA